MDARPTYDQKLAHILRVAASIFARKGYHKASVRDISTGAWGQMTTLRGGSEVNISAPDKSGWVATMVRQ